MLEQLDALEREAQAALEAAGNDEALAAWKSAYLSRKGKVGEAVQALAALTREERPAYGQRLNQVKQSLEAAYESRAQALAQLAGEQSLRADQVDVTLPGRPAHIGRLHPLTQTLREIYRVLGDMGFQVYPSRDVETDDMNFGLLNMPPDHPARDMWDTFYTTKPGVILRTHTSPGQIRAMREYCPQPIRVILPGTCYRYEQINARKDFVFHQVELLAVGKSITMSDLKGTLVDFARRLFGEERRIRFRASYFPFTEPSAEMDMDCILCGGKGCRVCKESGWVEILGCGMVHPVVLQNGGYDPAVYSGFAAGPGTDRIAMLKYKIEDIRDLAANDLRFLEQVG